MKRRRPPYSAKFQPHNGQARVVIGWPGVDLPAHCVALPTGENPCSFDWRALRGCGVFVHPFRPGEIADAEILQSIGVELARVGAESVFLFDGSAIVAEWWRDPAAHPCAMVDA